jgi:DNA recombination protein RmuC
VSQLPPILLAFAVGALLAWLWATRRSAAAIARLEGEIARDGRADQALRDSFSALAAGALDANSARVVELAAAKFGELRADAGGDLALRQQKVEELVRPVREGLERVQAALAEFDRNRAAGTASLGQQLRAMGEQHTLLAGSTNDLVQALRAPQGRGQWGEMQLRRVVELAGMLEHCDFQEQHVFAGEDGALRPDLIVHLPGDKVMIVDSKAPMDAYLDAVHSSDDTAREFLLDKHAKQVRKHIDDLHETDYASELPEAPDFVVMFLPGEDFFSAACRRDPSLIDYAVTQRVMPASPITLITMLKAVAYGWQQARATERVEEIRELGAELYGRLSVFADHLLEVRRGLQTAVKSFNDAVGSFESRVMPSARKFEGLGIERAAGIERVAEIEITPRSPRSAESRQLREPGDDGRESAEA